MSTNKTIKQLDKNDWTRPQEYNTNFIRRCYDYVEIPIYQLNIEQLRTLISQEIGVEFLIPTIIQNLKNNILAEGDFYPDDLLELTLNLKKEVWTGFEKEKHILLELIQKNEAEVIEELGEKTIHNLKLI